MKKVLIIESCPGVPHTDTSLEIAIREKEAGSKVFMGLIFPQNKTWEYSNQYPASGIMALSGFIQENIHQICSKFNIPVIYPKKEKYVFDAKLWKELMLDGCLFKEKWEFKKIVTSTVSALTFTAQPDLFSKSILPMTEKYAGVALNTYYATINLIHQTQPDLVYYYNGRWASCKPIEWAAEDCGIKVLHHERGSDTDKFEIYQGAYYSYEEHRNRIKKLASITNDETLRVIGSSHFIKKRNRTDTYWPAFASNQIYGSFPDILNGKKYIAYFTSSEDEFSQIPGNRIDTYFGSQFEAFKILKSLAFKKKVPLVIRVHPNVALKNPEESFFWDSQADTNTIIFGSKADVDTYALLDHANIVVTYGTTVGLEAAYIKKPSILIGNSPWFNEPGFHCPRNLTELDRLLDYAPANNCDFVYQYGYYMEKFGEKFKYFKPSSFWSGQFLGHTVQPSSIGL